MKYTREALYIGMKFYRTDINPYSTIIDIVDTSIKFSIRNSHFIHNYPVDLFLYYLKEIIIDKHTYLYELY